MEEWKSTKGKRSPMDLAQRKKQFAMTGVPALHQIPSGLIYAEVSTPPIITIAQQATHPTRIRIQPDRSIQQL